MGKIGPKFSHLLMVRAKGADPPSPPYGQPDRKKTVFFYDFPKHQHGLTSTMRHLGKYNIRQLHTTPTAHQCDRTETHNGNTIVYRNHKFCDG